MKHLRAFDTQAEYDNAVLQFPNVSSIGDDEVIYSMGLPFYVEAIENISVNHVGEYSMDCKNWMPFIISRRIHHQFNDDVFLYIMVNY